MRPTRILRASIMPVAVFALLLGGAAQAANQAADRADEPDNPADEARVELTDEPLDLSTPEPENGWPTRTRPFAPKPSASVWDGKAGIDYRKPSIPGADFQPDQLATGSIPDQSTGVAWATITGGQLPLGWDKASIETRIDPSQEQGKVGTTLSAPCRSATKFR